MNITQTTAKTSDAIVSQYKTRDKYGRSVQHFTVDSRTVCVLVTLPKAYAEQYGERYLVNDWASEAPVDVEYFGKRSDAVAKAGEILTRETVKANA